MVLVPFDQKSKQFDNNKCRLLDCSRVIVNTLLPYAASRSSKTRDCNIIMLSMLFHCFTVSLFHAAKHVTHGHVRHESFF